MLSLTSLSSLLLPSLSLISPRSLSLSRLPCPLFTPSLPSPTPLAFPHASLTFVAQALLLYLTKEVDSFHHGRPFTKRIKLHLTRLSQVPDVVLAAAGHLL